MDLGKYFFNLLPSRIKNYLKVNFLYKYISQNQVLVDEIELSKLFDSAIKFIGEKNSLGDYLEFGVFNGTSLSLMFNSLIKAKNTSSRLFGFDSFEGLPELGPSDSNIVWYPGQFKCSYETAVNRLKSRGVDFKRTHLIKGFFSETLNDNLINNYELKTASIIMIDCDMYSSTKEALEFSKPFMKDYTIIIFDDWYPLSEKNLGEKKAFEEFMIANTNFKYSPFSEYQFHGKPAGKSFLIQKIYAK